MKERIRLLFLATNAVDAEARLRTDEEWREIHEEIQRGIDRDRFEVVPFFAVRIRDLQRALLQHRPQIVHFSGVGEAGKGIFLEDDAGRAAAVSGEVLARLFSVLNGTVRVVVLNACESEETIAAFRSLVDYTIGMRERVTDRTAIDFAAAFYRALSYGETVPNAFALAVNQLDMNRGASHVPVLYTRPGVHEEMSGAKRERRPPRQKKRRSGEQMFNNNGHVVIIHGDGNKVRN